MPLNWRAPAHLACLPPAQHAVFSTVHRFPLSSSLCNLMHGSPKRRLHGAALYVSRLAVGTAPSSLALCRFTGAGPAPCAVGWSRGQRVFAVQADRGPEFSRESAGRRTWRAASSVCGHPAMLRRALRALPSKLRGGGDPVPSLSARPLARGASSETG